MTGTFFLQTFFEIAAVAAILYGILHEDKLVAFEDRILAKLKARYRKQSGSAAAPAQNPAPKEKKPVLHTVTAEEARALEQERAEREAFLARERQARSAAEAREAAKKLKRTQAEIYLDHFTDHNSVA